MISVDRASKGDRMMKATAGLSVSEFDELTDSFAQDRLKVRTGSHDAVELEINILEELFDIFQEARDIFIDGTERSRKAEEKLLWQR